MSISLVKGQKIDLTKGNAGLKRVVFALGWDTNRYNGGLAALCRQYGIDAE